MSKGQTLQDPFLNSLRKDRIPVSIFLVNGIKLQGQIESFDQYVVLLKNTVSQMVYKHAISTVVPARNPRGSVSGSMGGMSNGFQGGGFERNVGFEQGGFASGRPAGGFTRSGFGADRGGFDRGGFERTNYGSDRVGFDRGGFGVDRGFGTDRGYDEPHDYDMKSDGFDETKDDDFNNN